jgi:hypothetical protein
MPTAVTTLGTFFAASGGKTVTRLTSPARSAEIRVLTSGIVRIRTVWIVAALPPQYFGFRLRTIGPVPEPLT